MDCLTCWTTGEDWGTSQEGLEESELGWTRLGNSLGGIAKSVEKGVNSVVEKEEEESGMTGWEGNMEGQKGIVTDLEWDSQYLKGKIASLKTSLETKQVLVAKS